MRRAGRLIGLAALVGFGWIWSRLPRLSPTAPLRRWVRAQAKRVLWTAGGLALAGAALGFLIMLSGIVPARASSGHWAITRAFLNFAMRRTVVTHSAGISVPDLDAPALIVRGAGHYEDGCRPCHGAPGAPQPQIPRAMTPHPPELGTVVPGWKPNELFYIVKHGVKFTGMPAWPAQPRDDEVWAVVAFLERLPELDAAAYRALAFGPVSPAPDPATTGLAGQVAGAPQVVRETCARCHGHGGTGRGLGAFPKLAGQRPEYLYGSLRAYAEGTRHSGIMGPIAAGLGETDMREIARYYAGLQSDDKLSGRVDETGRPASAPVAPATSSRSAGASTESAPGEAIARLGIPARKIPSCRDCHGPTDEPLNPVYPVLAGQYQRYLTLQLALFKEGRRGGTPYAELMHEFADRLTADEIEAVAGYYGSAAETSP